MAKQNDSTYLTRTKFFASTIFAAHCLTESDAQHLLNVQIKTSMIGDSYSVKAELTAHFAWWDPDKQEKSTNTTTEWRILFMKGDDGPFTGWVQVRRQNGDPHNFGRWIELDFLRKAA